MKIVLLEGLGISRQVIDKHAQKLEQLGHTFSAFPKDTDPQVQLERSKDADVVMLANMPLSPLVVEQAANLKFIDVAFTGVDHIPMEQAKAKGIAVSNASGYATQAVAELAVSFMIQLLRNVSQTQEKCRQGGTKDGLVGNLLCGKTVGIVGAGAIGKKTAQLCKAFGCHVIAFSRSPVSDCAIDEQVSLDELLQRADIVSLHCPLTPQTKGLIGADQLAAMKPSAFLINTARGGLIDEDAAAEAIKSGKLGGLGLDAFEQEPLLESPLKGLPRVIFTPHTGAHTGEAVSNMGLMSVQNAIDVLKGEPCRYILK